MYITNNAGPTVRCLGISRVVIKSREFIINYYCNDDVEQHFDKEKNLIFIYLKYDRKRLLFRFFRIIIQIVISRRLKDHFLVTYLRHFYIALMIIFFVSSLNGKTVLNVTVSIFVKT